MKFRLGFRIALILVVLALTLSSEGVQAQRAGKVTVDLIFFIKRTVDSYGIGKI